MSYSARVYKVFIASPNDVPEEREIVRSVLARWNAVHSEMYNMVLLPVSWETHAASEVGQAAQEYINEYILDKCDILIGIFWTRVGTPTKNYNGGSVEEISRHVGAHKPTMLYFSNKPIPPNADLDQIQMVRSLKEMYKNNSFYKEYLDLHTLYPMLYDDIQIKLSEGKFRSTYDSDILARISDDNELVKQIIHHNYIVSKNLLINIMEDKRADNVWDAIIEKLSYSPADLRDTLLILAKRGAFRHRAFISGYKSLAALNQTDFCYFLNNLYSINKYEFYDIYEQGLLQKSIYADKILELIEKRENEEK